MYSELLSTCISTIFLWICIDKRQIHSFSNSAKIWRPMLCWFTCFVQIANMKLLLFWFATLGEQFQLCNLYRECKSIIKKKIIEEIINLGYIILDVQAVLCLHGFLRLWKNNRVSRKPCKWRSDLVLNGQMRAPK